MKKALFAKIFILFLIFAVVLPTMTGCGLGIGADGTILEIKDGYDHTKNPAKGTYVISKSLGEGGTPENGGEELDNGLVKRPFLVYGGGTGIALSNFEHAPVKIAAEHLIAHLAVNVSGAGCACDAQDGGYTCFASGISVSFDPFSLAATALSIGERIGNSVSGFSEGLAAGLMVAIWFGNLMNMVIHERFTPEAMLKGCMQLIIGLFVIYNSTELANLFVKLLYKGVDLSMNNGFASEAKDAFQNVTASYAAVGFNIPVAQVGIPIGYVYMDDIGVAVTIAIGSIMVLGAQISCAMAVISALVPVGIEIGLRVQLAPLVFAMTSQTGWTPQTIGYLKGCIAAGAAPALIVAIVSAGPEIITEVAGENASLLVLAVAYTVVYKALGGFVGNASNLAHQILH